MRANLLYPVWRLAVLLLPFLVAASCAKEDAAPGGDTFVTVTIKAPGAAGQQTRGLDATQQNHVQEIDILAFHPSTGRFEYAARCSGAAITGSSATKTFTITLRERTYDLLILANAQDIVAGASLWGSDKTAVTAALQAAVPPGGKWPADGSAHLPGWGEVKNQTITQGTAIGSGANPVPMTRMHAAVDIVLSAAAQANFELTSVRLYNYNTSGKLVPATGDPLIWNTASWLAIKPTPVSTTPVKGPVVYDNSAVTADKTRYTGEIFLFEAANGGAADYPDIVCLVVGGTYLPTGDPAYYRVDFSAKDGMGNVSYNDILRNHKYAISVTAVTGKGLPDPDEAYNSVPADIEVTVTDWNLGGNVVLDPTGQRYLWLSDLEFEAEPDGETFTMTIDTDATSWKAVVSESDVNPNAGGASWLTVSPATGGAGAYTLTITAADNDDMIYRYGYIHITADNRFDAVIKVGQDGEFDFSSIIPTPFTYGYVGAFWKKDQIGERLIRIKRDLNSLSGDWKASVVEGADWIMLDTRQSDDPGIEWKTSPSGTPADMNVAANDNLYKLPSGSGTSVAGNATSDDIYFRIGLKDKWSDNPLYDKDNNPVRYGLVLVTYNNGSDKALIFIRQGEDADYLMRPEDSNEDGTITTEWGGTALEPRPDARKYSPYNLTAAEFNTGSTANTVPLPQRSTLVVGGGGTGGGVFTSYPSMAGAFFKWAGGSGQERYAYHPIMSTNVLNTYDNTPYWSDLAATHETCPPGYRRATDGSTTAFNTVYAIADSETRQSLHLNPCAGIDQVNSYPNTIFGNIIWGYYADGYFDRYTIKTSTTSTPAAGEPDSGVNPTTSRAGYIGALYYNPETYASLFFPASGYRSQNNRILSGATGWYSSSSTGSALHALYQGIGRATTLQFSQARSLCVSIRCVKE